MMVLFNLKRISKDLNSCSFLQYNNKKNFADENYIGFILARPFRKWQKCTKDDFFRSTDFLQVLENLFSTKSKNYKKIASDPWWSFFWKGDFGKNFWLYENYYRNKHFFSK